MSTPSIPPHMENFTEALSMVKNCVPHEVWQNLLRTMVEVFDYEVMRFVRMPPKPEITGAMLGWFQGRGALMHDFSMVFDTCTEATPKIREKREKKEREDAQRRAAAKP